MTHYHMTINGVEACASTLEPKEGKPYWRCSSADRTKLEAAKARVLQSHPDADVRIEEGRCRAFFFGEEK